MDKRKRGKGVSPEMFIGLAENAKAMNLYAGLLPGGQQMFLEKFTDSEENRQRKQTEELTK